MKRGKNSHSEKASERQNHTVPINSICNLSNFIDRALCVCKYVGKNAKNVYFFFYFWFGMFTNGDTRAKSISTIMHGFVPSAPHQFHIEYGAHRI